MSKPEAEVRTPKQVVVVGGGVGGTRTANLLARKLKDRAVVELITASPIHLYSPGLLRVPFEDLTQVEAYRPEDDLLRSEVVLAAETPAVRIDTALRQVVLSNGRRVSYDALVIATGTDSDEERIPGLIQQAHSFRTQAEALRLREVLQHIRRGRVVVGLAEERHPSPTAPLEFALLLADYLERWGVEKHTEIVVTHPALRLFPDDAISRRFDGWLAERKIGVRRDFLPNRIGERVIHADDGRELEFDLLVMEPPQQGVEAVRASGLGDARGFLSCDPYTLGVTGMTDTWAVGECSSLQVGQWPSSGLHQAAVVAAEVAARVTGVVPRRPLRPYDGRSEFFLDLGRRGVALVNHSYERYVLHRPSRWIAAGRKAAERAYWQLGPTGRW